MLNANLLNAAEVIFEVPKVIARRCDYLIRGKVVNKI